jgi:hypothetical protein
MYGDDPCPKNVVSREDIRHGADFVMFLDKTDCYYSAVLNRAEQKIELQFRWGPGSDDDELPPPPDAPPPALPPPLPPAVASGKCPMHITIRGEADLRWRKERHN